MAVLDSLMVIKAETSRAESINVCNLSLTCLPGVVMGSKQYAKGISGGRVLCALRFSKNLTLFSGSLAKPVLPSFSGFFNLFSVEPWSF